MEPVDEGALAREQLVYLLNVFFAARCWEHAFLIALVLKDEEATTRILVSLSKATNYAEGVRGLQAKFEGLMAKETGIAFNALFARMLADHGVKKEASKALIELEREVPVKEDAPQSSECIIS